MSTTRVIIVGRRTRHSRRGHAPPSTKVTPTELRTPPGRDRRRDERLALERHAQTIEQRLRRKREVADVEEMMSSEDLAAGVDAGMLRLLGKVAAVIQQFEAEGVEHDEIANALLFGAVTSVARRCRRASDQREDLWRSFLLTASAMWRDCTSTEQQRLLGRMN